MSLKVRYSQKHAPHRAKLRARTTAVARAAEIRHAGTMEEHAALISSALASDNVDIVQLTGELLSVSQHATGAIGSALFRNVHDTGLLVPLVRGLFTDATQTEREELTTLMERAADNAAISLLAVLARSTTPGYRQANFNRPFQRRSQHGQFHIVATAIVVSEVDVDLPDNQPEPPIASDGLSVPDKGRQHAPAQLLGIWITAVRTLPVDPDRGRSVQVSGLDSSLRRLYPFFKILLRQQMWRESAESAKRQSDKRIREVATIYEIGQAVDRAEIDTLLQLITRKAASVMDAQACSLLLKDASTGQLIIAASFGLPDEVVENTRVFVGEGIAGRVAQTGEPLLVNYDVRSDPRFHDTRMTGLPGISSSISMPMKDEYKIVQGVLCIRRRTPAPPFSAEDERLFGIFATQASMAIKHARLYGLLRSRVQELSTLSSLTEAISSTLDLDYVLNQLADNLIHVVGFDRCLIYLRSDMVDESQVMVPRITRGFESEPSEEFDARVMDPGATELIKTVAGEQIPVLVEEDDDTLPMAREYALALGLRSFYAQPIVARNDTIGVLVVTTDITRRRIALANLDLLVTFLQHAGIAIENARLYKQMEQRIQELNTLYTMSRTLNTTYGLSRTCATVNKVGLEITKSDAVLLLVFNERRDTLRLHNHIGLSHSLEDAVKLLADSTTVSREARSLREPTSLSVTEHRLLFGERWTHLVESLAAAYPNLMIAPLVNEEANVGFLILGRSLSPYRPEEFKLASIISSQAAAVLRNAAIYEHSVEQRVLELSALYELSKKVRNARSLGDALDSILDIVSSVVMCDDASISVVDPERRSMQVRVWRGDVPENLDRIEQLDKSPSITAWVVREQKALLSADITSDARFTRSRKNTAVRSVMVIPFFLEDDAMAVLHVQSGTPNLYTEDNVKMLSLIAAQAAALYREMQSLRELTTYTDNVLQSIPAGVVTLDASGRIVTFNAAAQRLLRLKGRDVFGTTLEDLLPDLHADLTDREDTLKMVAMAIETGGTVQRHGLRYFSPESEGDGSRAEPVIVNGSASQLLSERGEYLGVVLVFEDITKEQVMERELQRISRLAEIGQLAAGIAHELRNPLASIKGAAQVVLEDMPADPADRGREFLNIIVNEVNVLNGITSEFLEFSRPATPNLATVNINDLLERRIRFMRQEFERNDIAVREVYGPDVTAISIDAGLIERVAVNILLNAVQAMPNGGVVTITTRQTHGPEDGIEIEFADTGMGINPDELDNIFAPFFTTKTKGTGLGLAIVQKTVDMHGGRIRVKSAHGEGTAFTLWLPAAGAYSDKLIYAASNNKDLSEQRLHAAMRPLNDIWDDEEIR